MSHCPYNRRVAHVLETDARRRISLAKLGVEESSFFLAEARADGSILLTPAEVRPKVLDKVDNAFPGWEAATADVGEAKASALWDAIKAEAIDGQQA